MIMNKKGALVLRDLIFMFIIFSGVMTLSALLVINMGSEYSNTNMTTEFSDNNIGSLGNTTLTNISLSIQDMKNETDSSVGSLSIVTEAILGIPKVLVTVLKSPILAGDVVEDLMVSLNVPGKIPSITATIITLLIYAVIIFVIVSAFLKGGKV